ncbi:FecR family protein [Sunxiuqinia sp. sy24]|uniref:FecR family protein n=1 Tax=Sunxiuqinia sp. sy24 TaxID=3461495 RepID=UPI00404622C1
MEKKIQHYLEGKLPEEEQEHLLAWIRKDNNQERFDLIKKDWWKKHQAGQQKTILNLGQSRLRNRLKEKQELQKSKRYLAFYRYASIALLVLGLSGAAMVYRTYSNTELQYTAFHTDPGQISSMTLSDGTRVWINSGTQLRYNNQYGVRNRDVQVVGEAYFEVAKDKKRPFIVDMGALKVEVTGTQFGVSNYADTEEMNVVLKEGSVNIRSAKNKLLTRLKPDELALFNKQDNTLETLTVEPESYIAWKDGILHFFELPLEQLAVKLEKRYNQQFEVDSAVKNFPYTFSIEGESLSEVLHLIERVSPVKAIQEEDVIKFKYMNH